MFHLTCVEIISVRFQLLSATAAQAVDRVFSFVF